MTGGEAKADAVALALSGAGEVQLPVAGARGHRRTLWLLDRTAAGKLTKVYQPPTGEGVRLDSGYAEGNTVTPNYDPMIAQ